MGAGIAQVGAQTGHKVTLVDLSQEVLDKSQARINESIKRVAKKKFKDNAEEGEKFIAQSIGQLSIATNPDEALSSADLVVEVSLIARKIIASSRCKLYSYFRLSRRI